MRVLVPLAFTLLLLPTVSAEAYIHGRLEPVSDEVTLTPGARAHRTYDWSVTFEGTTCSAPIDVGVDFIVANTLSFAGANFDPAGDRAHYPESSGTTRLDIDVDPETVGSPSGTFQLVLTLNSWDASACAPTPTTKTEGANVTVQVEESTTRSSSPAKPTNGSPAFTPLLLGVALVVVVARRRRVP